jgi:hypothetical protein
MIEPNKQTEEKKLQPIFTGNYCQEKLSTLANPEPFKHRKERHISGPSPNTQEKYQTLESSCSKLVMITHLSERSDGIVVMAP